MAGEKVGLKVVGAVEILGAPLGSPCGARPGAVWGLGAASFKLVAAALVGGPLK